MTHPVPCPVCGFAEFRDFDTDHCPNCLSGIHEYGEYDLECGGTLEPVSVWADKGGWRILQRCSLCGQITACDRRDQDNPVTLLSIAARPLADPPFPIARLRELTDLMGGQGSMEGFYREQRKQETEI